MTHIVPDRQRGPRREAGGYYPSILRGPHDASTVDDRVHHAAELDGPVMTDPRATNAAMAMASVVSLPKSYDLLSSSLIHTSLAEWRRNMTEKDQSDPFSTVRFGNWSQTREALRDFPVSWVFRGQCDSAYSLVTSLQRLPPLVSGNVELGAQCHRCSNTLF